MIGKKIREDWGDPLQLDIPHLQESKNFLVRWCALSIPIFVLYGLYIWFINMSDLCVGELIFDINFWQVTTNMKHWAFWLNYYVIFLVMRFQAPSHRKYPHEPWERTKSMEQPFAAFFQDFSDHIENCIKTSWWRELISPKKIWIALRLWLETKTSGKANDDLDLASYVLHKNRLCNVDNRHDRGSNRMRYVAIALLTLAISI